MAHDFVMNLHAPRDSLLPFQGSELDYSVLWQMETHYKIHSTLRAQTALKTGEPYVRVRIYYAELYPEPFCVQLRGAVISRCLPFSCCDKVRIYNALAVAFWVTQTCSWSLLKMQMRFCVHFVNGNAVIHKMQVCVPHIPHNCEQCCIRCSRSFS